MAQFSVHRNANPKSKALFPYVVDVQTDLLRDLQTRVVVPLMKRTAFGRKPIKELTPIVEVEGQKLALIVPQLAGISIKDLGPEVATLVRSRSEIVAALDFLLTGV